ncbi:MAG TPA: hypothetical protein PL110_20495, partial [Candidatus Eremiobacteraeota bacterium]|nr:hypothetical protein [Candidatus Eremiobacteraeota bacterium]
QNAIVRVIYLTTANWQEPIRLSDIREALSPAFCIYGIIRKTEERKDIERAFIPENLTFMEALNKYLEQEQLQKQSEDIKHYAQLLERELWQKYDTRKTEP